MAEAKRKLAVSYGHLGRVEEAGAEWTDACVLPKLHLELLVEL